MLRRLRQKSLSNVISGLNFRRQGIKHSKEASYDRFGFSRSVRSAVVKSLTETYESFIAVTNCFNISEGHIGSRQTHTCPCNFYFRQTSLQGLHTFPAKESITTSWQWRISAYWRVGSRGGGVLQQPAGSPVSAASTFSDRVRTMPTLYSSADSSPSNAGSLHPFILLQIYASQARSADDSCHGDGDGKVSIQSGMPFLKYKAKITYLQTADVKFQCGQCFLDLPV